MMEKNLEMLMNTLSPSEAESFSDSFEAFGEDHISPDVQSRILSSVMRKAGSDMKENITVKKTRKHSKRFVGFAIAAAVFATSAIGAGAYAFAQFNNRHSVEKYMGEQAANEIESMGLANNSVSENEHLRVTLDTMISDGRSAQLIFTLEKLDDEARSIVNNLPCTGARYADDEDGGWIQTYGGHGGSLWDDGIENDINADVFSFRVDIHPDNTDLSRPIKIDFNSYGSSNWSDPDIFDGIEFILDLSQNVETVTMSADNGGELILSPFGVTGQNIPLQQQSKTEAYVFDFDNFFMIRVDGTREPMTDHKVNGYSGGFAPEIYFALNFQQPYDLNDYIGIEIEGVEYLKQ